MLASISKITSKWGLSVGAESTLALQSTLCHFQSMIKHFTELKEKERKNKKLITQQLHEAGTGINVNNFPASMQSVNEIC